MSKIAVIYWSGTGNTEAMANGIVEGIQAAGGEANLYQVSSITADQASQYDKLVLGCSSMGAEVLEEVEFEPFFTDLEKNISGKKVALFGSYGWGDGQWMREWQERSEQAGVQLFEEGFMINETPDEAGLADCRSFGDRFVKF